MSLLTSAEIKEEYLEWITARRKIAGGAQSYKIDTGQGSQTVTRADLPQINKTLAMLKSEYDEAVADESGESGIIAANFTRY